MSEKCNIEIIQKVCNDIVEIQSENNKGRRVFISTPMNWSSNDYSEDMYNAIIKAIEEEYKNFDLTITKPDETDDMVRRLELLKFADIAVFINGYIESNVECMGEYKYTESNPIFDIVTVNISIDIPIEVTE